MCHAQIIKFMIVIDVDVEIQYLHARENAVMLILTHGFPWEAAAEDAELCKDGVIYNNNILIVIDASTKVLALPDRKTIMGGVAEQETAVFWKETAKATADGQAGIATAEILLMASHAALVGEELKTATITVLEIIPTAALQDGKMLAAVENAEPIKDTATDATGQVLINV